MSRYGDIKYGATGFEGGGRKNLLINGNMAVAERTTSNTGIGGGDGYPVCDRWLYSPQASTEQARFTVSQDTASIGASDLPFTEAGIKTALKFDVTTAESSVASGEAGNIAQRIEGLNCSHIDINSDPITLSFYAKSDVKTGTMCASLYASSGNLTHVKEYSITTSWARYILTFAPDSDGTAFARDETNELQVSFALFGGSGLQITADAWSGTTGFKPVTSNQINFADNTNNNFYLTGVQLEKGPTATAFEREDFHLTLERCKRYYFKHKAGSPYQRFAFGQAFTTDDCVFPFRFYPEMRGIPTLGTSAISKLGVSHDDTDQTVQSIDGTVSIDTNTDGSQGASVKVADINGDPMTANAATLLMASNDATAYLEFDAEL